MDRYFDSAQMRLFRQHDMSLNRGLEILVENGAEAAFDMASEGLADFGLLARHRELHGSNTPFGPGLGCPRKTWACACARSSSASGRGRWLSRRATAVSNTSDFKQFFPAALDRRRNAHRFPVLGDSPPGNVHPIRAQQ